jgi:hypothetical protein
MLLLQIGTPAAAPLPGSSKAPCHLCRVPVVCSQTDDKQLPAPAAAAGGKSIKARQNSALAAVDDAASYSLRCIERGRVDPTAASGKSSGPQEKSALPADWGFLK